jgi:hypothetical protein
MANLVGTFTNKVLHDQQLVFTLFGTNFYHALDLSQKIGQQKAVLTLTASLASYTWHTRNLQKQNSCTKTTLK